MIDLKGHAALITGATQGVGQAIAVAFAKAGADLVLHGLHDDAAAAQSLEMCRAEGVQAKLITGDLAGSTQQCVDHVYQSALSANSNLDILVNNAGTYIDKPYLEMDHETFEKTMRLNVYSYYFLTQRFCRNWVADEINGRVLMVGSINAKLAEDVHTAYDTSKGAVESMVKSLCVSLAPMNIRVNGIAPGLFYTPLTAPALDDPEFKNWMEYHTPNKTVPTADVCGEGAVYLVSDAARHVHGHMLMVDGGMSVWQQPDPPKE